MPLAEAVALSELPDCEDIPQSGICGGVIWNPQKRDYVIAQGKEIFEVLPDFGRWEKVRDAPSDVKALDNSEYYTAASWNTFSSSKNVSLDGKFQKYLYGVAFDRYIIFVNTFVIIVYILFIVNVTMFKTLFQVLAGKFLETALKVNGAKKISEEDFKKMILRNDSKVLNSLSNFLNISKEDVKKGITEYKKLLKKNKKGS